MDYKEFLRKHLLDNTYGIYGKILEAYGEQMVFLKTASLFRKWLADELDVPIDNINLNSLNSVLKRKRKKGRPTQQEPVIPSQTEPARNKPGSFKFSNPSSDDEKTSRIQEY